MTDDFAIQQQKPSAVPYLLGGAAVGGLAGWGATKIKPVQKYVTDAKYASYSDLINEKEDSFKSSMEGVDTDLKTKAENARKAAVKAGEDWDNALKAYQEANKEGAVQETEEFKNLKKTLEEAEAKAKKANEEFNNARKVLVDAAEAKIKATNTGVLTDAQKQVVTKLNTEIAKNNTKLGDYNTARDKAFKNLNNAIQTTVIDKDGKVKYNDPRIEILVDLEARDKGLDNIESHLKDKNFKTGKDAPVLRYRDDRGLLRTLNGSSLKGKKTSELQSLLKKARKYQAEQYNSILSNIMGVSTITNPEQKKAIAALANRDLAMEVLEANHNNLAINDSKQHQIDHLNKMGGEFDNASKIVNDKVARNAEIRAAASAAPTSHLAFVYDDYNTTNTKVANLKAQIAAETDPAKLKTLNDKLKIIEHKANNLDTTMSSLYDGQIKKQISKLEGDITTQQNYKKILRFNELTAKDGSVSFSGRIRGIFRRTVSGSVTRGLTPAERIEYEDLTAQVEKLKNELGDVEFNKLTAAAEKTDMATIESSISRLEGQLKPVKDGFTQRMQARTQMAKIKAEIEKLAGKGATINAAGEIFTADGKKFDIPSGVKLTQEVGTPLNDAYIQRLDRTIAKLKENLPQAEVLTPEEIRAKAEASIAETDSRLATELTAKKDAQKLVDASKANVETERAKLPKGEAKTADELKEIFIKEHGERKAAVDKAAEGLKKDLEKLFEGKINNKKLCAVIAGGAAAGMLLGAMFKPSSSEA